MQKSIFNDSFTNSDKKMLEKIFQHKSNKQFAQGLRILKVLEKRFPNDSIIIGLMATFYFERKKFVYSAKYFKKGTILNPDSEISSLGLFHSLINIDRMTLALKELRRFVKSNKYKHYKTTIKELQRNISDFGIREQKLIKGLVANVRK